MLNIFTTPILIIIKELLELDHNESLKIEYKNNIDYEFLRYHDVIVVYLNGRFKRVISQCTEYSIRWNIEELREPASNLSLG